MPLPIAVQLTTLPIPAALENQDSLILLIKKIARLSSYFPYLNKEAIREFPFDNIYQGFEEKLVTVDKAYKTILEVLNSRLKAKAPEDAVEAEDLDKKQAMIESCQELFERIVFYTSSYLKRHQHFPAFNVKKFNHFVDDLYLKLGILSNKVTGFLMPSIFFSAGHYLTVVRSKYQNDSIGYALYAFFNWQETYKTELEFVHQISLNPYCSEEVRLALVSTLTPALKGSRATDISAELLSKVSVCSAAPFVVDYSKEEIVLRKGDLQVPELFQSIFDGQPMPCHDLLEEKAPTSGSSAF
jgi:hypothetical protein